MISAGVSGASGYFFDSLASIVKKFLKHFGKFISQERYMRILI